MSTKIEYIDETVNCVIGCTKCSPACQNCWAIGTVKRLRECMRFSGIDVSWKYGVAIQDDEWSGKAVIDMAAFKKCRTKKPKTFLLSSLGDWLHESLSTVQINSILNEMNQYPQHSFFTFTKRPGRWKELGPIPPNVWLGASVWNQPCKIEWMRVHEKLKGEGK